jgi:Na+-driven multidrug efflux pump
MDGKGHPRTGITGLAWRIDQFLRAHIGWPYRWILSVGLTIGLSQSATTIGQAFNTRTFASLQTGAIAVASALFQAALLINQLAQVSEMRRERLERRAAEKRA